VTQNGRARVFDDATRALAERIVAKYPNKRSAALPLLFLSQSVEGYVTEAGMKEVAGILGLTAAEVLATSSFYTMLKKKPTGEYLISVCRNISCTHLGAHRVFGALEERLGIETGATTPDGRFTLESAECLATCDGAPSMQVNYEDFYRVSPESAVEVVDRLMRGDEVLSTHGAPVKTHKEISAETAASGLVSPAESDRERTIGGESPRMDTAPGTRPKVTGDEGGAA
jgi:NADH-quinone oxidoreductase subunit E